MKSICDVNCGI